MLMLIEWYQEGYFLLPNANFLPIVLNFGTEERDAVNSIKTDTSDLQLRY